jgi:hypothetical protein
MNLTNKLNLPDGLVRAIQNDSYDKGDCDFSCTGLLKPARQAALLKKHAHEIVEDASDRIWSLLGQAAHTICERANKTELAEKRFFGQFGHFTVSAQIDSLDLNSGVLCDYKVTTMYKAKPNEAPDADYTAQLNIQAEILRMNGHTVNELRIIAILRDWSKSKTRFDEGLPQANVAVLKIPMWSSEQVRTFVMLRIHEHMEAENELPRCSASERWAKDDVYAVVKGKRAINGGVQFSQETAEKICAENPGTRVEFRQGESVRCELYCPVSEFCEQFKKMKNKQEECDDEVSRFA